MILLKSDRQQLQALTNAQAGQIRDEHTATRTIMRPEHKTSFMDNSYRHATVVQPIYNTWDIGHIYYSRLPTVHKTFSTSIRRKPAMKESGRNVAQDSRFTTHPRNMPTLETAHPDGQACTCTNTMNSTTDITQADE